MTDSAHSKFSLPHWFAKLRQLWKRFHELRAVLRPAWFAALMSVIVSAALQVDQARDVLVQIASESERGSLRPHLMLFASALLAAVAAWYFPRALLYLRYPFTPKGSNLRHESARRWVPRLLGFLPLASLAVASWRSGLVKYGLFYLVIAVLFVVVLAFRRRRLFGKDSTIRLHANLAEAGRGVYLATGALIVVSTVLLILFLNSKVAAPSFIGALGILLVAAVAWLAFGSTAVYFSKFYTIPSILGTLLLLAVFFSIWNDNHQVRTLNAAQGAAAKTRIAERPALADHFQEWLALRRKGWEARTDEPFPLVVVAAEGGGIRAAYWTAAVLATLEDAIPGFSCHVYAVSGVSGGSLGGAVYSALLADRFVEDSSYVCDGRLLDGVAPGRRVLLDPAKRTLEHDFLAPVLAGLLFPDLMQRFWPIPGPLAFPDRAVYLELAWEAGWRRGAGNDRFAADFLELWQGETAGEQALLHQVPSLLLNGTWVETGGRAVTSNLKVATEAAGFVELQDLLSEMQERITLSTAVHMSARFTYVSPAGTIDTARGVRRIVDGGYFENSGGLTAAELFDSLIELCREGDCGQGISPVAVYVKNDTTRVAEVIESRLPLVGTLSPVRALLKTRGARGRHAEATLKSKTEPHFYRYNLEYDEDAIIPLGWVLSRPTRDRIHDQLDQLPHVVELEHLIREPAAKLAAIEPTSSGG